MSNGCKVALTALVVAVVMGSLGFVAGFLTHTVLVTDAPGIISTVIVQITPANTSTPEEPLLPTATPLPSGEAAPPTSVPSPSLMPTVAIPEKTGETFDLFWEAWDLIQNNYYGDLPSEEDLTYGAIRGALNTLDDPYTGLLEPDVAAIERETYSGTYEGIGATVTMKNGLLQIVNTLKGQPAEKAGLRAGDIVLQVDDTPIENMSLYEAIALIRGPAGTPVRLTIFREGEEPFEVEIVRARMDIPVMESEMRDDGIAYAHLLEFSTDATVKLGNAIDELLAQNPKGLILDLRGNPGGFLNEAVKTSGLFLPQGKTVVIERTKDGTEETWKTTEEPIAPDIPLVVLVDGSSASASEIVAGALQDYGRAVLVGETTFGKGSVWVPYTLSNGAELRVTFARWFTPNDRAIHGQGLEPDITVELTEKDYEAGQDPQLDRAVEYLLTGQ
jgi:carboxyl-terminal processing protease